MISQSAEYALRALLCLAGNDGAPLTTHQIAQSTDIPAGYLAKLMQSLGRAGLVGSQRGLNGGFVLRRDPAETSLLDVVRAIDPSDRICTCPLGIHGTDLCPLHKRLDEAAAMLERSLGNSTIAELIEEERASHATIPLRTRKAV